MKILRTSLSLQMVLATILGICCGLFFGDTLSFFKPWTDVYIMILKITILPYLIVAIIHGVGLLNISQAKEILKKGVFFIGLAWGINLLIIYLTYYSFPKVKGTNFVHYMPHAEGSLNFAELLIPENIFSALNNNIVPAIVIFSLLIGIAFMYIKEKQNAMSFFETIVDALTKLTSWISKITPIGTFMIIAYQVGSMDLNILKQMITYIILYVMGVCIVIFWIFPRLTAMLTNLSAMKWLKDLLPILLLAYTTNVVIVCLPFIMQLVQRETLLLLPKDEKAQSQIQGTVSVIFNLPLGSLFIILFVLFCSSFYHVPLSFFSHVELFFTTFLTGLGAVGIGSWLNSLSFIIDNIGLPHDTINLFLITVPFTSGFQSMVSAMEIATLSLFITFACRKLIHFNPRKFIPALTITFAPVVLLFVLLSFKTPFPPIENTTKSIYEIQVTSHVDVKTFTSKDQISPVALKGKEDTLARILRTKVLRVGYYPNVPPFCFYNVDHEITGFDVMMAHMLAHDLECRLEFVPMDYKTLGTDLGDHLYDIGMSAVTINENRLQTVAFSTVYEESKYLFVAKNPTPQKFSSMDFLRKNEDIEIAVLKGSAYENTAKALFPKKKIILLNSYEDFAPITKGNTLLLWSETQAIAWLGAHPQFHIIYPNTSIGKDLLAYPINAEDSRFLTFINQWLELKKSEGFLTEQYNLWVLGETGLASPKGAHWSVLNNVLRSKTE